MKSSAAAFVLGLALLGATALHPTAPEAEEGVVRGKMLYNASCVRCHGIDGTGGEGPTLNTQLRRADDDESLQTIIRSGIPQTDMPGTRHLNAADVSHIAAYVRSLTRIESMPITGNADNGEALFFGDAICTTCHIVHGRGQSLGPDLTRIGDRRGVEFLRQHIRDPSAAVPESFLMVRVQTRDGKAVRGIRVNEDAFTIQLRDEDSHYHSFQKTDLAELVREPKQTFMPRYRSRMADAQIDDLVAYLASLRGAS